MIWFFTSQWILFQICQEGSSWVEPILSKDLCLAQGHSTVTLVRLKPSTPWSCVKYSTTEPLSSLYDVECYLPSGYSPLAFLLNIVKVFTHFCLQHRSIYQAQCKKNCMLLSVVIHYHSKNKLKTHKSCIFYPLVILLILFIILRHKKEVIMYAYKVLFERGSLCPVRRHFGQISETIYETL